MVSEQTSWKMKFTPTETAAEMCKKLSKKIDQKYVFWQLYQIHDGEKSTQIAYLLLTLTRQLELLSDDAILAEALAIYVGEDPKLGFFYREAQVISKQKL